MRPSDGLGSVTLEGRLQALLARRQQAGLMRSIAVTPLVSEADGLADFSSNDYLGLARNGDVQSRLRAALSGAAAAGAGGDGKATRGNGGGGGTSKVGSTGSRLLTGNSVEAVALESMLAAHYCGPSEPGSEPTGASRPASAAAPGERRALLFNSGYDANLALFSALPQRGDLVLYDELIHASVHDGLRMRRFGQAAPFRHNDVGDVRAQVARFLATAAADACVLVAVEAVYSMDGDMAPIAELAQLAREHGGRVNLVVDESELIRKGQAHSTGVIGERGAGLVHHLGADDDVYVRLHTFGKAMGAHGAVVIGTATLVEFLVNYGRPVIYSTMMSFHSLAAIRVAHEYVAEHWRELQGRLQANIRAFRRQMGGPLPGGARLLESQTAIQGIVVAGPSAAVALAQQLVRRGQRVQAIRFPSVPRGAERVRLCVHAHNSGAEGAAPTRRGHAIHNFVPPARGATFTFGSSAYLQPRMPTSPLATVEPDTYSDFGSSAPASSVPASPISVAGSADPADSPLRHPPQAQHLQMAAAQPAVVLPASPHLAAAAQAATAAQAAASSAALPEAEAAAAAAAMAAAADPDAFAIDASEPGASSSAETDRSVLRAPTDTARSRGSLVFDSVARSGQQGASPDPNRGSLETEIGGLPSRQTASPLRSQIQHPAALIHQTLEARLSSTLRRNVTLENPCPVCEGAQFLADNIVCPACNGTGEFGVPKHKKRWSLFHRRSAPASFSSPVPRVQSSPDAGDSADRISARGSIEAPGVISIAEAEALANRQRSAFWSGTTRNQIPPPPIGYTPEVPYSPSGGAGAAALYLAHPSTQTPRAVPGIGLTPARRLVHHKSSSSLDPGPISDWAREARIHGVVPFSLTSQDRFSGSGLQRPRRVRSMHMIATTSSSLSEDNLPHLIDAAASAGSATPLYGSPVAPATPPHDITSVTDSREQWHFVSRRLRDLYSDLENDETFSALAKKWGQATATTSSVVTSNAPTSPNEPTSESPLGSSGDAEASVELPSSAV
ncbi:hypothetical protein HK105_207560 [Polyrhizophydium stewartii]|uniref:Aminotransferase class I/classII large domain-containing protein n=1 Tax=Polyrhizophydium stewartii TaxID=2732419 RepID=A0ABR4N0E7_9FUNG